MTLRAGSRYPLSAGQVEQYATEGFIVLPSVFTLEEIGAVRSMLDPLFEQFQRIPRSRRWDLGADNATDDRPVRSAEILAPSQLDERLTQTSVYHACRELAACLCGSPVEYKFDHAIYKMPFSEHPTAWHQDKAYSGPRALAATVHFWVPLQEVKVESGCMHYLPRMHQDGLIRHQRHANGHVLMLPWVDDSRAIACPLRAGDIVAHFPLTPHYASGNQTGQTRRAWILHFGPWGRSHRLRHAMGFG